MMTRDLMLKDVVTIYGNVPVREAIELLFKRHVGCIVVVDDEEQCIGHFHRAGCYKSSGAKCALRCTNGKNHD